MPFPVYALIDGNILAAINHYVIQHEPAGHFVMAVLKNDLHEAFKRADENNTTHLFHVVCYCHNEIPSSCWGSPMEVGKWLNTKTPSNIRVPESPKEMQRQVAMGIWNTHAWKIEEGKHAKTSI